MFQDEDGKPPAEIDTQMETDTDFDRPLDALNACKDGTTGSWAPLCPALNKKWLRKDGLAMLASMLF